jgi:mRNA interferase HigB
LLHLLSEINPLDRSVRGMRTFGRNQKYGIVIRNKSIEMNVISYKAIRKFARKHANARSSLEAWYKTTVKSRWQSFDDVRKTFNSADIYRECTIFNIGGNNYRLIASINYEAQTVYIKEILTHAEYDKEKWKTNC